MSARPFVPSPRRTVDDLFALPEASSPPAGALSMLVQARTCIHDARTADRSNERYAMAYLAALRAALAVVLARSTFDDRSPTSAARGVWQSLSALAPELREWAGFFAGHSERRVAAEAGVPVPPDTAELLFERSNEFLDIVSRSLLEVLR